MLTDRQLTIIKIIAMIGLTFTILAVGTYMYFFKGVLTTDPCALCSQIPIRIGNITI
jgi:disulfide bond formation protein DsbB